MEPVDSSSGGQSSHTRPSLSRTVLVNGAETVRGLEPAGCLAILNEDEAERSGSHTPDPMNHLSPLATTVTTDPSARGAPSRTTLPSTTLPVATFMAESGTSASAPDDCLDLAPGSLNPPGDPVGSLEARAAPGRITCERPIVVARNRPCLPNVRVHQRPLGVRRRERDQAGNHLP